jgi:transposase-like protein
MGQKSGSMKKPAKQVVKEIRRVTRRQFSAEEKIRIVLTGLRGEDSIAELCRREGIVENLYYRWSTPSRLAMKSSHARFRLMG